MPCDVIPCLTRFPFEEKNFQQDYPYRTFVAAVLHNVPSLHTSLTASEIVFLSFHMPFLDNSDISTAGSLEGRLLCV